MENIVNQKIPESLFMEERKEALQIWPTGSEVDLQEGLNYMLSLSPSRVAANAFSRALKEQITLIHPRGGTVPIEAHIDLIKCLENAGADIVPVNNDNYSRQMRFQEAERGLERTIKEGRPMLNGFPAILYGVKGCRRITEAVGVPVSNRFGPERDCRIGVEIGCASGMNYYVMSAFGINFSYNKDLPLKDTLKNTQYAMRLIGYYEEHGAPMVVENYMTLTGTLVPPGIAIICLIIDALLAADQGVKAIVQQFGLCGCLEQDIAAIQALGELGREYLDKYGYSDVQHYPACAQYMGAFPLDEAKAFGLISLGSMTACLGGARMILTKSPQEAFGIPTKESNAAGVKATKQVITMLKGQRMKNAEGVILEKEMIKREVNSVFDKVLDIGEGDILEGSLEAFKRGIIDIPFSPSIYNAGKSLPIRDCAGAVRYYDPGHVPLPYDVIEYHKMKINERTGRMNGRESIWKAIYEDIIYASR